MKKKALQKRSPKAYQAAQVVRKAAKDPRILLRYSDYLEHFWGMRQLDRTSRSLLKEHQVALPIRDLVEILKFQDARSRNLLFKTLSPALPQILSD